MTISQNLPLRGFTYYQVAKCINFTTYRVQCYRKIILSSSEKYITCRFVGLAHIGGVTYIQRKTTVTRLHSNTTILFYVKQFVLCKLKFVALTPFLHEQNHFLAIFGVKEPFFEVCYYEKVETRTKELSYDTTTTFLRQLVQAVELVTTY